MDCIANNYPKVPLPLRDDETFKRRDTNITVKFLKTNLAKNKLIHYFLCVKGDN